MKQLLRLSALGFFLQNTAFAVPVVYKDAHTDITGTWNGSGTVQEVTTNSPYEGTHHYQFTYNYTGYWAGFGLNMDNWGGGAALNFSGYDHLRLAYRGLSTGQVLQIQLRNGNNYGNSVDIGGPVGAYTVVDLSMIALTVGSDVDPSAVREIDISVSSSAANGSGAVYVDAVELVNSGGGGVPASPTTWARANTLVKGVNCSNWLEAWWLLQFGTYPEVDKYTRAKVSALRTAGFDVFRLPIIFERLGSTSPPYAIDFNQTAFHLVDSMILWAQQYDFKLVIDNHHGYDLTNANYQSELPRLLAVWQQITQHYTYLDPSRYFFEIFNEPTDQISNANFRSVANQLLEVIRANETQTHSVFVGADYWNSGAALQTFEPLDDADVIYTFHTYDPFLFTHQGFSWTNPPYFPARTFPQAGEVAGIQQLMAGVKAWSDAYDVPASMGEFGVSTQADAASRCNWIQTMTDAVNANGFSYLYWDAISPSDAFGFYTGGIIDQAHVIPCFSTAMGLYSPLVVTLESFKVECSETQPHLQWTAFADAGGNRFDVERSGDGLRWEFAGTLPAQAGVHAYQFDDLKTSAFYRLRMNHPDGSMGYSPVQQAPCIAAAQLSAYPNPAFARTRVKWSDTEDPLVSVQVYDMTGRVLVAQAFEAGERITQYTLPLEQFVPGLYRVAVWSAAGKQGVVELVVE